MDEFQAWLTCVLVFWLLGFALGLAARDKDRAMRRALFCAGLGSALGILFGARYFLPQATAHTILFSGVTVPGLPTFDLEIYVDALAGLFILLISFFGLAISIYSWSFLATEPDRAGIAAVYNLYLASLVLVALANNVFFFLLFWELMTLTSAYLVLYRHNKLIAKPKEMRAADYADATTSPRVYLIASHISTVFIALAFLGLAKSAGSFSFQDLRVYANANNSTWVFLLALVGLGIKAGMTPFHIWLPYAHPSSPANVHALMSGVMIKIAVYAMLRVFFEFLGVGDWWWGALLLTLASITTIMGVLYAIFNSNLKTALAYHSIENIGIILAGVGLALMFRQAGGLLIANLALIAALYHLINHAMFKGLLFLCVGAIERLTGTVEMNRLGGLVRHFPWTSGAFVVGALAIAGLPPLNGFVSEWLTLQALMTGLNPPDVHLTSLAALAVQVMSLILLGNAFALTAFCFAKIVATILLGQCRETTTAWATQDVPFSMRGVLLTLAGICLLLGVFSGGVINHLSPITTRLLGIPPSPEMPPLEVQLHMTMPNSPKLDYVAGLQILPGLGVALVIGIAAFALVRWRAPRRPRPVETPVWMGGSVFRPAEMQPTEAGMAFWILRTFGNLLGHAPLGTSPGSTRVPYLRDEMSLSQSVTVTELFRRAINRTLQGALRLSEWFGLLVQNADVRMYLLYIFLSIILMIFVILMGGR